MKFIDKQIVIQKYNKLKKMGSTKQKIILLTIRGDPAVKVSQVITKVPSAIYPSAASVAAEKIPQIERTFAAAAAAGGNNGGRGRAALAAKVVSAISAPAAAAAALVVAFASAPVAVAGLCVAALFALMRPKL